MRSSTATTMPSAPRVRLCNQQTNDCPYLEVQSKDKTCSLPENLICKIDPPTKKDQTSATPTPGQKEEDQSRKAGF